MDAMTLYVEATDIEVTYYRHGQGEPLLFLHAILGLQGWEPILDELSTTFDVIAPYAPGWGPSQDWDSLDGPLDIALFYDDFLQSLGVSCANVLGISIGAWMAAELAAIFPQRVQKLMLLNPIGIWFETIPGEDPFAQHPMKPTEVLFSAPSLRANPSCFRTKTRPRSTSRKRMISRHPPSSFGQFRTLGCANDCHESVRPRRSSRVKTMRSFHRPMANTGDTLSVGQL